MMGAELLGEFSLVGTPADRRYLETHVARILDGEMTKAADADDRDQIACLGWRIAQRSERGQTRAQEGSGRHGIELIRHDHQAARLGDHHFGIPAVMLDARIFLVLAMNEVACTASRAVPARAGQKANPDPLAHRPTLDPLTQRVDPADHLMARYTRPGNRERAGDRPSVAMTDPTSLDTDADIAGRRFAQRLCREFKLSRRDRLDRTVGGGVVGHIQNSCFRRPGHSQAGCSTMRSLYEAVVGKVDADRHEVRHGLAVRIGYVEV